jgi:hypothetical protein
VSAEAAIAPLLALSLRLAASSDEPGIHNEERLRLPGADLVGLHGPVDGFPVELLVDGEPGRARQADGVRHDAHVGQARTPEQAEELTADPRVRHRCLKHFGDLARQRRVRRVDHGGIGVEVR